MTCPKQASEFGQTLSPEQFRGWCERARSAACRGCDHFGEVTEKVRVDNDKPVQGGVVVMDDIDLTWKFVEQSLTVLQEQVNRVNAAAGVAMLCPESPLWEPAHVIGSRLVQALSELVDDNFDHISWYVSECDFGRSPKEAGCIGEMRLIDTVDKLRWLVGLECEGRV